MKLLVVKPSSLGDVLHAFPAVAMLRQRYPDATIGWIVNPEFAGMVELFPAVDELHRFNRQRWGKPWLWHELTAYLWRLRRCRYDVALDFQGLFRSGLLGRCSGAPRRIGFTSAREGSRFFYTETVAPPPDIRHAVDKNTALVQASFQIQPHTEFPELLRKPEAISRIDALCRARGVDLHRPTLVVAPASRWSSKTWPPEFFAQVINRVATLLPNLACWLVGTQSERPIGERVAAQCGRIKPENIMGETSLAELLELFRRSHVLLTNDSGPMHLMAAVKRPTVALFGPTDPTLTGPYGHGHVVFKGDCEAGPCFRKACTRDRRHCVQSVSPEAVAAAIAECCHRK